MNELIKEAKKMPAWRIVIEDIIDYNNSDGLIGITSYSAAIEVLYEMGINYAEKEVDILADELEKDAEDHPRWGREEDSFYLNPQNL